MPKRTTIRIDDLSVQVWEPDGPPSATLLLLHGLWVGGWSFEGFADGLAAAGYACFAPTYRGHGDSRPVADVGSLSVLDYVEDARTVLHEVGAQAVIGHSGGGLVAQKLSESEPGLRALALMNSAPPRGIFVRQSWKVVRSQAKYLGRLVARRAILPDERDHRALFLTNAPAEEAAEFYGRICADSGRALAEILTGRIAVDPARIGCPVYVVATGLDVTLGPPVQRRIARKYRAVYAEYPHLGHHWFIEQGWEVVLADLEGWLQRRLAPVA